MSLLQEGLSIAEEKLQVGNGREGWTLGAALAEGGRVGIGRPILEQVLTSPLYQCSTRGTPYNVHPGIVRGLLDQNPALHLHETYSVALATSTSGSLTRCPCTASAKRM